MIKNGRRGSLSGKLTVRACRATSPIRSWRATRSTSCAPALAELAAIDGTAATSTSRRPAGRCRNIHAGTGAGNVIPGELVVDFNFRFSTESTPESLKQRVQAVLDSHGLDYDLDWTLGGEPFLTPPGSAERALDARDPAPRPAARRCSRPPAARRTAASSRRSARR